VLKLLDMNKRSLFFVTTAHFTVDWYTGYLTPLLPVIMKEYGLDISMTTMIPAMLALIAAFSQPFFGIVSDRLKSRYFMILAVLLTGISTSLMGSVNTLPLLILVLSFGRLFNSAFHPEGASFIGDLPFKHKGRAMSLFSIGGSLGGSLSPIAIVYIYSYFSFKKLYLTSILAIIVSFLLLIYLPPRNTKKVINPYGNHFGFLKEKNFKYVMLISLMVILRTGIMATFNNFLPLYFSSIGYPLTTGGIFLTSSLLGGSVGTIFGGYLSDKIGRKWVNTLSFTTLLPIVIAFLLIRNIVVSYILFILFGFATFWTMASNVVYAQEMLPNSRGFTSSLVMGVAWGTGSIILMVMGRVANKIGIIGTLWLIPILISGAIFLSFSLKESVTLKCNTKG